MGSGTPGPGSRAWQHLAAAAVAAGIAGRAAAIFYGRHGDIKGALHSENAFYFSFYEQVVGAASWREAVQLLYADTLSEAPGPINALRRFNIYQELLFGLLCRGASRLSPAPVEPAFFYCACVFVVYGFGLFAMEMAAPRSIWSLLLAGALYHANLEEASHVSFMPPLRENCGVPLWLASCACLQLLHERRDSAVWWPRLLLVLSCTGFLLIWQFACFALAMQVCCLYALAILRVATWRFVVDACRLYTASALLSSALRLGDLWVVRSIFFWLSFTVAAVGHIFTGKRCGGVVGAIGTGVVLVIVFLAVRQCTLWLVLFSGASLDDDTHIFEFLAFRVGLRKEALSYHAALYEGQRSFSPPTAHDWARLCETLLLPAALLAAAAILAALACARGVERQRLFPHALLLLLACATAVPFLLMMRYRMLFLPQLALLGSAILDEHLWPAAWRRAGVFGHGFCALLLAVALGRGDFRGDQMPQPARLDAADNVALMQWLRDNTAATDIVVSDMGLSALIRLHAGRPVVCHPHYESAQLRERCFWADKLYGHRTPAEYHGILRRNVTSGASGQRIFVALSVQSCNAVDEMGRSTSDIIERDAPHRTALPKTCELLYLMAAGVKRPKGFAPRHLSRWYAVLEVLGSPQDSAAPLQLSPQARCDLGRYLWEALSQRDAAEPHFRSLPVGGSGQLDLPCLCAASHFWPAQYLPNVHRRALLNRTGWASGAFGCCEQGQKVLQCIGSQARRLQEVRDLVSAEGYHRHAVALTPSMPRAHGFLGFTLIHAGRYLGALESFQRAIALEGAEPVSTTLCGEALAWGGLGDFGSAAAALRRAEAVNPKERCASMNPGLLDGTGYEAPAGYEMLRDAWESYEGGVHGWSSYLASPAVAEYAERQFSGQKLLFLGDGHRHLPMVLQSLGILRQAHRCDWPAEFWIEAGEVNPVTAEQREELRALNAELHVLPSPYGSWRRAFWEWRANLTLHWGQAVGSDARLQKYALKPAVVMLSGCEVCLFLDADNVPLQSPDRLLKMLPAEGGIVAWPDLWDAPASAELWGTIPEPIGLRKAQESGQLLVRKAGPEVLKALALAALFAVRLDVFLGAIYGAGGTDLVCGYGDKDAFHLAFRLLGAPFQMAAPLPAVATTSDGTYVGLLQLEGASQRPLFLHGAWAKEALSQLLRVAGSLRQCDFLSESDARNLDCIAHESGGSASVPMDKLKCRPLSLPVMKRIAKALVR